MRAARIPRLVIALGALVAPFCVVGALAQAPPLPVFQHLYGRVRPGDANLEPPVQAVVAIARGRACGEGTTQLVSDGGPDNGTVYVVDVLGAGQLPGGRPGCAQPGDEVSLWFPASGWFAPAVATWQTGSVRGDVGAAVQLANRLLVPQAAADGTP